MSLLQVDAQGATPWLALAIEAARGTLSNKQIGARLFISDRTVATHVGNILKLGFNSRAK